MIPLLAAALVAIFLALALLHLGWALGRRHGAAVIPEVDGKPAFSPGPAATLVVATGLCACAVLVAAVVGWITLPFPLPEVWLRRALWAMAGVFLLRAIGDFRWVGFFKKVRGTSFARLDSLYFSPLCLGIALGAAAINLELP